MTKDHSKKNMIFLALLIRIYYITYVAYMRNQLRITKTTTISTIPHL